MGRAAVHRCDGCDPVIAITTYGGPRDPWKYVRRQFVKLADGREAIREDVVLKQHEIDRTLPFIGFRFR